MATISGSLPAAQSAPTPAAGPAALFADTSAANATQRPSFGSVLASATGSASSSTGTDTDPTGLTTGDLGLEPDEPAPDLTDPTQLAAQAAAGLLVVGPGIVLSSSGSPVAAATGTETTPTTAAGLQSAATAETLSRSEQLRLRLAAAPQALPQAVSTTPTVQSTINQAATPAPAPAGQTAAETPGTAPATPIPGTPGNPFVTAVNAQAPAPGTGLPAGRSVTVPPQAPVVNDLVPTTAAPAPPVGLQPQPVAAPADVGAVPGVQTGDRATSAGDRFAAIIADAERLQAQTPVTAPPAGAFAGVLADTAASPLAANPNTTSTTAADTPAALGPTDGTTPVANATVAPPSAVVTAAPALSNLQPQADAGAKQVAAPPPGWATLTAAGQPLAAADQFTLTGVSNRATGSGPAVPGAFADVFREQTAETANTATPTVDTFGSAAANSFTPSATTSAAAGTAPAAPPMPAHPHAAVQVAEGVVAHARTLDANGTTEFQLRLDPPELGRVHVRLVADGEALRGQVVVADDTVKRMIESQLPELRQKLEQAGVTVTRFDVSTDAGAGAGGGNGSNPFRGGTASDYFPSSSAAPTAARTSFSRPAAGRPAAGRLDVTV